MSQLNKILMVLFAILISVILGLAYLIYDFDSGDCKNRVVNEFLSPGAIYKAVIFERSCGNSDKKSTQISIVRSFSELPEEAGNVFIIDGQAAMVAPKIYWQSAHKLWIYHRVNGKEYRLERQWGEDDKIKIDYVAEKKDI